MIISYPLLEFQTCTCNELTLSITHYFLFLMRSLLIALIACKRALMLLPLVAVATSTIACPNGQTYLKIVKKTLSWASEESFMIISGSQTLYTSPSLVNNDERTLETCLTAAANNQYTLKMKDTFGDSWTNGGWIKLYSINENIVFKGFMDQSREQDVPFSLYSPIDKNAVWKFSNNYAGDWRNYNFADSGWTEITLGVTPTSSTGTQYFRKQFAGIPGMAAVEMQFQYRYGIIAYINGAEVYRDNMPSGEASQGTSASGSYQVVDYHGTIRSAAGAENAQSVLAVEIHFLTASLQTTVDFNAFISYLAGVSAEEPCFVVPTERTATSTDVSYPDNAFSWTRLSYASVYSSSLPATMFLEMTGTTLPAVNGLRIWPYTNYNYAPSNFEMYGGASAASPTWNLIFNPVEVNYESSKWKYFKNIQTATTYPALKFVINSSVAGSVYMYEMQPLVCNIGTLPSITYPSQTYQMYAKYNSINAVPTVYGMTNCQSSTPLPNGITLNPNTCAITGAATAASPLTTYTITASVGTATISGTITMSFLDCSGYMIRILRTYRSLPGNEGFRINNSENDAVLLDVSPGHTNPANANKVDYFCVTVDRFDVTLYSTSTIWQPNSYIYVYGVISETEEELLLKARYDNNIGNDAAYYLRRPAVKGYEQWYYKMGEVPQDWTNSNTDGWQSSTRGSFPESTNAVQLYKKTFTVSSLDQISGAILSIRYQYGCLVYLNGHEVFRNKVDADMVLSASSTAVGSYNDLRYRVITVPGKKVPMQEGETEVSYFQQGTNTIAIAIVAISATSQKTSYFDAIVRLMTNHPESHIFEFTATGMGISGTASNPFNMYYGSTVSSETNCPDNELIVTLNNDRREWISSVMIQNYYYDNLRGVKQFKLYGRNGDDEWTLLKEVTGLTYSTKAQKRRIYFNNNKAYNQFKFENFSTGNPDSCQWQVQQLNLYADNVLATLPALTYATTSVFKNIEMSELIPTNNEGYSNFRVAPSLPAGLVIDPNNGWISGTASVEAPSTAYTVTVDKITGGTATATLNLEVGICANTRSLMTVRFRADSYSNENSWKLYAGRGTSGTLLESLSSFPVKSAPYYIDFCKDNGIYTFQGFDSFGDGWQINTGYTLTVDLGSMELDIQELRSGSPKPLSVSTVFSTFFPFQIEYSEWKVYQNEEGAPTGWNTVGFDDSQWRTVKAAAIPTTEAVTTYIRKTFQMPNVDDYQVLNVRVKYAGGVAAYLNGNLVAVLNMDESFDHLTESLVEHDPNAFSKFHIILGTAGIQQGENVISFEIHRKIGGSSSDPVVFDATGVFGVEDCSTVVDSYSEVTSSALSTGTVGEMMDLDPYTHGRLPNTVGTFVEWTVENVLGSKWNSFNILQSATISSWGFDIYGYYDTDPNTDRVTVLAARQQAVNDRTKPQIATPVGLAGFRKFRWEIVTSASATPDIGSIHGAYCKATGAICPAVDKYPSVGEGQISVSTCDEGYNGYTYRECSNGQLGEVKMNECKHKLPALIRYSKSRYTFVIGTEVTTGAPTYRNIIEKWYVDEGVQLPEGLSLDATTGAISGKPTTAQELTSFTVYAENPTGAVSVVITMTIRKGECKAEGVFPKTEVGTVAKYECSMQGSYVGTQTRACVLGESDGVWQKASGFCMSVASIVILIFFVIIVIVVVVFILMRMGGKAKAVGGVKGKKSSKTSSRKASEKKGSIKTVKV